jgi:hypothetical protein
MIPILKPGGEGYAETTSASIGRSPPTVRGIDAPLHGKPYRRLCAFTITPVATWSWRSGEIVRFMISISSGVNSGYLAASSIPYGW